ncbi:MAG: hypothetical protein ACFFD4_07845 [Candidatus Odinarchaeota archaeon]
MDRVEIVTLFVCGIIAGVPIFIVFILPFLQRKSNNNKETENNG